MNWYLPNSLITTWHLKFNQGNRYKILLFMSLFALLFSACNASIIAETNTPPESKETDPIDAPETVATAMAPQLMFTSLQNDESLIVVMNADGTNQRQLTDSNTINVVAESLESESQMLFIQTFNPAWSPDNQQIAFGFFGQIFAMNADGSEIRKLTDGRGARENPSWSPDGHQIAFTSNEDGDKDIWVMNRDGTDRQQLTKNQDVDDAPDWSPDGQLLAFHSGFPLTIYLMNADGGDPRPLLNGEEGYGWEPAWSPDGQQIAFVSLRDGDDEIFVVNVDGSDLRQITVNIARDGSPAWSPDGQQLAFASDRDGDYEIYVMNVDGSDVRQLTGNDFKDHSPEWLSIP